MDHGMGCPECGCMEPHHMDAEGMKMLFKSIPWKIMLYADELGIDESQVVRIRQIHTDMIKRKIQMMSQAKIAKIDLMQMLMQENIDVHATETKVREIAQLKSDMYIAWIQAMSDMQTVLSHEQRMRVRSMVMSILKHGGWSGMDAGGVMETEGEEE